MADEVGKMKVADLKRELKIRGLTVTGNKNELVERLQAAIIEGDVFDSTGISEDLLDEGDDILNDDELDEETKRYLNSTHDEDAILKSPHGSTTSLVADDPLINTSVTSLQQKNQTDRQQQDLQQQKKIVLKRKSNSSFSLGVNNDKQSSTETPAEKLQKLSTITPPSATTALKPTLVANNQPKSDESSGDEKKAVKFSELTMRERLELRAKKFGAAPSGDAVKLARAERFGLPASENDSKSSGSITSSPVTASVDVLKKRAERFGGSVSKVMTSMENKEKMQKRQERFGSALSENDKTALEEKAKQRLERFKTAIK